VKFIAVVDDRKKINVIANQLRAMGCAIQLVLKHTGVITGDSGQQPLSAIQIPGLKSVEEDRTITQKS
jgi:hypothetical protein